MKAKFDRSSKEYWEEIDANVAALREDEDRNFFAAFDTLLDDIERMRANAVLTRGIPREKWHVQMLSGHAAELARALDRVVEYLEDPD